MTYTTCKVLIQQCFGFAKGRTDSTHACSHTSQLKRHKASKHVWYSQYRYKHTRSNTTKTVTSASN